MKHIIFGFVAIALGVWGIARNWWAFLDLFNVVSPILLGLGGAGARAAGITSQLKTDPLEETAPATNPPSGGDDGAVPSS